MDAKEHNRLSCKLATRKRTAEMTMIESGYGAEIARMAIQSVALSARDILGTSSHHSECAATVSAIFTNATHQEIMLGTNPKHVLSTSLLCNSLLYDKRFTKIPVGEAAPGDIIMTLGGHQAVGFVGIVVEHGRIVSLGATGAMQDNSSLAEAQMLSRGRAIFRYIGVPARQSDSMANAGFNANEPRLPAGQSGGGRWTKSCGDATERERADVNAAGQSRRVLDNGTVVNRKGHHVSPVQTWRDQDGKSIFSKDVTDRLNEARVENADINHNFSSAHRTYNARAQEITDQFVQEAKNAGIDPSRLSGGEAREFADKLIQKLDSDSYLGKFNRMVKEGQGTKPALNAMRDAALAEGVVKEGESGAEKALGKLNLGAIEKGSGLAEHLPGALKVLGIAAAAAEFYSDLKSKGFKTAAKKQIQRYGDFLGQTPDEDQAMRQKASHWFYKKIGAESDENNQ